MDDVFTPENLKLVKSVTQRVGEVDGVQRVVSLANAPNVRTLDDEIEIVPFLEELPRDTDAAEQIRADLEANPIYVGSLVSHDSRAAALVVHLREMPEQEFIDEAIDTKIVQVAIEASGDADVWLTGPPHVKAETSRLIIASLSKILPISFAIMAAIGLLAFRSLRGMLVPISTVLIALVWTLGAVAWLGVPLNLVSTIVPPLLLTVGFAYVVHVVSDYYRSLREDPERLASSGGPAGWALRHVALPVALTGVTTVAGFLSLRCSGWRSRCFSRSALLLLRWSCSARPRARLQRSAPRVASSTGSSNASAASTSVTAFPFSSAERCWPWRHLSA
jgi:predicted RND superfamily exporter protein